MLIPTVFPSEDNWQMTHDHPIRPIPFSKIVELKDRGRPQLVPGSGGFGFGSRSNIQCPGCKTGYLHYPRMPNLTYHCGECHFKFDIYGKEK